MLANITFYQTNRERLKQLYSGRYLLIIEQKVWGDFTTWAEACRKGLGLLHQDNFLIKYCS
ncbi:hypothetical protein AHMF7605_21820 [Adhaeribacter arboris]|uniref:Uncharacterized protein n=1 Tax=Adhaeribacter arboris TaxID=2072846 RepID=A0A2T2YKB5_9BACT|nr:hypothetical protein [Adhaeribacter arboris]PSR55950.1 hypothetical protein AHMF7605_21820 [Adhaeribacter arboris]